jgi:hypothetical protein
MDRPAPTATVSGEYPWRLRSQLINLRQQKHVPRKSEAAPGRSYTGSNLRIVRPGPSRSGDGVRSRILKAFRGGMRIDLAQRSLALLVQMLRRELTVSTASERGNSFELVGE